MLSSQTASPLVYTSNLSSSLSKCHIVIPKDVEQLIIESEKRVNK